MNWNRQMELHYINTGCPYTVTESFMNLFDGLTYSHADYTHTYPVPDQERAYWAMLTGFSYKFGNFGPESTSYYGHGHAYEIDDHLSRVEGSRRAWENPLTMTNEEFTPVNVQMGGSTNTTADSNPSPEECVRTNHNASSSQVTWQDNVDPDNMSYEELLDLGEAVGTQSRGLSQDLISLLPISKYKCHFFSRKRSRGERCVVCQMEYKNRDRLITLPCKHFYHAGCGKKWLSINKACPICYTEVSGEEPRQ